MDKEFIEKAGGHMGKVYSPDEDSLNYLSQKLPGVWTEVVHPVSFQTTSIWTAVITLYDYYDWTREQIADWLDQVHERGEADVSFPDKS